MSSSGELLDKTKSLRGQQQIPATFSQQRLWFLDQMQPGSLAYLICWNIRLCGDLRIDALEATINELVRRHKVFRTTFAVVDGDVAQVVASSLTIPMPLRDLTGQDHPEHAAERIAHLETQRPIDLVAGPLLRASLLRLSAGEHILLLTLHHIIFDGSSRAIFIKEFSAIYAAFRDGRPSPLPDPRVQYADYAVWQRRGLRGKHDQKLLDYWKKQLADAPASLALPTDRPRPAVESFRGATVRFELSKELSANLTLAARQRGASVFMVLLAAFQVLLSRYCGQDDILVGIPVAGRTRTEFEGLIGYFANQLVLRMKFAGEPNFNDLIDQMKNVSFDAFEHQEMPLDRLVQELNPDRSLSHNPLFHVLFSLRNYQKQELELAGLDKAEFSSTAGQASKFDLSMFVTEGGEQISGWIEYNVDLFDESTIVRMAGHYESLLHRAIANPTHPIFRLPLLTAPELEQLSRWNATDHEFPRTRTLHSFIEEQVLRTPEATALVVGSETLSFRELNERSNQLARYLIQQGVVPEMLVGVCVERSFEMVVALLGVMKAGGIYVPVDPDYPASRIQAILEDTQTPVVLTQEHLLPIIAMASLPLLCLDRDWPLVAAQSVDAITVPLTGDNPAYAIYTSGSTGKPKGVPNLHKGIVNRLLWMQHEYGLSPADRVLQKTPYSFDVSVWEFFWPLMQGARLVMATPEGHKDPDYLVSTIQQHEITTMHFVPSMLQAFLEAKDVERCVSLKRVICSGEALPRDVTVRFFERLPDVELHNLYGPTEAAVDVTYFRCEPGSERSVVPIGRPVWNTQIHILDALAQQVPVGVPGELHIAGVQIARGYLNRPELTAEKFIANPFAMKLGQRMYRTGDLCRWMPDGNIEYLGRLDHQVKLRGFRIELGEIETVLGQHPAVQSCAVLVREDEPGDKRLVAYIVPSADYRGSDDDNSKDALSVEQVSQWALTFDESYQTEDQVVDVTFNIAGWNSSYSGQAIPAAEMRVWVDTTVERLLSLKARRVWEIGCGTGLLLFRVAPYVDWYCGTDISSFALRALSEQLQQPGVNLPQVTLEKAPAHEFNGNAIEGQLDLVVLNSVIQYFPNADYLVQVLSRAVEALHGEGSIFVGDVRNFALLKMFQMSVELYKANDNLTVSELSLRVEKAIRQEGELVVDPEFFSALQLTIPRITRVEIQLKRGFAENELSRFRYDVVLHVGQPVAPCDTKWIDWVEEDFSLPALRELLIQSEPESVGLVNVPNARLELDVMALAALGESRGPSHVAELRSLLKRSSAVVYVQPESLWELGAELRYAVEIRPSSDAADGYCDVVFLRIAPDATANRPVVIFPGAPAEVRPWESFCSNPLRQNAARMLVPQIRTWLAERLPEFMLPSLVVSLERMPLSANGKIDRKMLAATEQQLAAKVGEMGDPIEEMIANIWADVLKSGEVTRTSNFFDLGGHSLLATKVVARLRQMFNVELPLRAMFEAATIGELADRVRALLREDRCGMVLPLIASGDQGPRPLSFAQQRLWFLDQLEPNNPFYNVPWGLRLMGALDVPVLEAAFAEIVQRHESLRSTFQVQEEEPVQVVAPELPLPLTIVDLSHIPEEEREEKVRTLVLAEVQVPFSLSAGPLFRIRLIKVSEQDHALIVTLHHAISDGWSVGVLSGELAALYEAFHAGKPSPLSKLTLSYGDFAVWQRAYLSGGALDEQLSYLKQHLLGAPVSIELPTDRPRPLVQTSNGAKETVLLPSALFDGVKALSRSQGATLFMTLLSAFNVLLSRYSGQYDIVVGTAVAGRHHSETEKLIGFFVNTLVLRNQLSSEMSFDEFLRNVRETTLSAYANQDVPFEKLVQELNPVRDTSRSPLFQAMIIQQNAFQSSHTFHSLEATRFTTGVAAAKVDLLLNVAEHLGELRCTLEYNTDLYDSATIHRMLEHYRAVLESVVTEPSQHLSQITLLRPEEKTRLLCDWNSTAEQYPEDKCLHELIQAQAARNPGADAVLFRDGRLSYGELDSRANRLAQLLQLRGVGVGARVGIFLERSENLIVAMLGVLKAGAAYVPLDPAYPPDRIRTTLAAAGIALLVTEEHLLAAMPECDGATVCMDGASAEIAAQEDACPQTDVSPKSAAYVIFTSGSTGRPKGVEVGHRGVVNLLTWMSRELHMGSADVFPALASFAFDMSVPELFLGLSSGGAIALGEKNLAGDGEALRKFLLQNNATIVHATPTTWSLLLDAGFTGAGLKRCIGAEPLPGELYSRLMNAAPGTPLYNFYGPTETTVWSTYHRFTHPDERVVIGRPLANTQVYLLDVGGNLVPVGVLGEIHIGGDGVALGYLNDPSLTAQKFIADPFSMIPGARLYRSGDLGRYLPDGRIEFAGRVDHQVKVRGYRVELGEIETVLNRHMALRECIVAPWDGGEGDFRLVAYVVFDSDRSATPAELREWTKLHLPEYMVPSAVVVLDRLPLSPNGKVDRKALPAPGELETRGDYVAPRGPAEELLCQIWAAVLKCARVGIEDNFFYLGGHSLLATRAISRTREAMSAEIPLSALFEFPTIAGLAQWIAVAKRDLGVKAVPPMSKVLIDAVVPLSYAQQRLWFLDQLEPDSPFYNVPWAVRLSGELDAPALGRALEGLMARHETLRTSFVVSRVGEQPMQVVSEFQALPLTTIDLRTLREEERLPQAISLVREDARRPFKLAVGPLFRVLLVRLGEQDNILLVNLHHAISDGWSLGIMAQELATLYEAFRAGESPPLEPLTLQYRDFAAWQRQYLSGDALAAKMQYWIEHLAGAPPSIDLPTDRPRPPVQTFEGARRVAIVPETTLAGLKALGRREGATLFMTLLAAFNVLLSRYSGQLDLVVGTAIAAREKPETEKMIGFFANTLALRADLSGEPTFVEFLRRVRTSVLASFAHADMPFEKLVEELNPVRDMSRSPVFQVMFIQQNAFERSPTFGSLGAEAFAVGGSESKMDLILNVAERDSELRCALEYNTSLYDAETIEGLLDHYKILLQGFVENSHREVSKFEILNETEKTELLFGLNDNSVDYPVACLQTLFEAQVERQPDSTAMVFGGDRCSYQELDRSSNCFAHYLASIGVTPGSLVGVCMERCPDMVCALLGILKVGAAYIPLDPTYPADRLSAMLEDGVVQWVVGHEATRNKVPSGAPPIFLDASRGLWKQLSPGRFAIEVMPTDLAYVIHTSGSTGRPKGAMVHHAGVSNCLSWMQQTYQLSRNDKFLFRTSLNFDPSVWEIFWTLSAGAQIIIAPPDVYTNAEALIELIASEGITFCYLVPSLLAAFVSSPDLRKLEGKLRCVISGGEKLSLQTIALFQLRLPGVSLHHSYGPTETSIASAEWTCVENYKYGVTPIGRPIANTLFYVLDSWMRLLPRGAVGELFIGGAGVGLGYLNRPDLTAQRFIANPFAQGRLYKTGDTVRYLPDGNLEFVGRTDAQVKIRGFRIELGEIESVLSRHVSVRECVVLAREDEPGNKILVAYIVPADSADALDFAVLRTFARPHLPEYMMPVAWMMIDRLPLSPNGKVDRKALPQPEPSSVLGSAEGDAPHNPLQELIAGMFSEVLKIENVGIDASFFELGGHSLSAMQVMARVRHALEIEVPLRFLFAAPTIRGLAEQVENHQRKQLGLTVPPMVPVSRNGPLPLSFAQQRLWFLAQMDPENPLYNAPMAMRMKGIFNVSAFEQALEALVQRHEVLRTRFAVQHDEPIQVIDAAGPIPVPVLDLMAFPESEREAEASRILELEAQKPFSLANGPMLRALLVRLGAEEHILLLNLHHIATDGWSTAVILRDLAASYAMALGHTDPPLPPLTIQYADYAVWQRNWLQGDVLRGQLDFWKSTLLGAPPFLQFPTDRPRPEVQTYRGDTHNFQVPLELMYALKKITRQQGSTSFMILLAAFQILASYFAKSTDIVLGTDVANRTTVQTEDLIGFFVNLLVIRADLAGDLSFREHLSRVRLSTLDAYAHQEVPFNKLVEELQPERSHSHNPLVQVLFVQQNTPRSAPVMEGLELSSFQLSFPSKFDMAVFVRETDQGLSGVWQFNADLFDIATVEKMAALYLLILKEISVDADIQLRSVMDRLAEKDSQQQTTMYEESKEQSRQKLKGRRRMSLST